MNGVNEASPTVSTAEECGGRTFAKRKTSKKRYIVHVFGFNFGLLMRPLFKVGTPKGWAYLPATLIFGIFEHQIFTIFLVGGENPFLFVISIS